MLPILSRDLNRLNKVNNIFDLFDWKPTGLEVHSLPFDFYEDATGYRLEVDMPGVAKGDINVLVEGNILKISGERKVENQGQLRSERWVGSYSRAITLPRDADSSQIKAQLKDGVLSFSISKLESAKPKTIDIAVQ